MTASRTTHDKEAEKKADEAKVEENGTKDFGTNYKPLDPSSHENDPALPAKEQEKRDKGDEVYVDTSASRRTADADDEFLGWTNQMRDVDDDPITYVDREGEPGQRFHWQELPVAESVEGFGVDSRLWPGALPLHEDGEKNLAKVEKEPKSDTQKRAQEKVKSK